MACLDSAPATGDLDHAWLEEVLLGPGHFAALQVERFLQGRKGTPRVRISATKNCATAGGAQQ